MHTAEEARTSAAVKPIYVALPPVDMLELVLPKNFEGSNGKMVRPEVARSCRAVPLSVTVYLPVRDSSPAVGPLRPHEPSGQGLDDRHDRPPEAHAGRLRPRPTSTNWNWNRNVLRLRYFATQQSGYQWVPTPVRSAPPGPANRLTSALVARAECAHPVLAAAGCLRLHPQRAPEAGRGQGSAGRGVKGVSSPLGGLSRPLQGAAV
jgi:hypothetical protein